MNQIVERIALEQKELFTQSNKLKKLKISNKTILQLSNLNPMREQIQYMLKKRQILKKHGCVTRPYTLVATKDDYEACINRNSLIFNF